MTNYLVALLMLYGANSPASAKEAAPPVIAMLEDYVDTVSVGTGWTRTTYEPRLRGVFFKTSADWQPMCDLDENGVADVCPPDNVRHFRAVYTPDKYRHQISVIGLMDRESCCRDVGWLSAPKIGLAGQSGDRTLRYGGWSHEPVHKPIPLTNRSRPVQDPEGWKDSKQSVIPASMTWHALAAMVGEMKLCTAGENDAKQAVAVPWKNTHLAFHQKFTNRHGQSLMKVLLSDVYLKDCGRRGGSAGDVPVLWPEIWLVLLPGRDPVIHVFKSRIGFARLELIEFGDFDGDGKTEGLFFLSGYNRDGYVLLHENMTKQTKFVWSYH